MEEGEWDEEGIWINDKGNIYEGKFEMGKFRSGTVEFNEYSSLNRIELKNIDGNGNCNGRIIYENGDVFEGTYNTYCTPLTGKIIKANKEEYIGSFINGKLEGIGQRILTNGNIYNVFY